MVDACGSKNVIHFSWGPRCYIWFLLLWSKKKKRKKEIKKNYEQTEECAEDCHFKTSLHHLHIGRYLTQALKRVVSLKHRQDYYLSCQANSITLDETLTGLLLFYLSFAIEIHPTYWDLQISVRTRISAVSVFAAMFRHPKLKPPAHHSSCSQSRWLMGAEGMKCSRCSSGIES